MSGVEVVGVVLGTIPLIIAGLEHYGKGLEMIRYTKSYATIVETHLTTLAAVTCIYRSSCENLLGPLMLAEEKLVELLESAESDAWKDDALQQALVKRLGPSQASYMAAIKELDKKILRLKDFLHLDDNMKPKWLVEDTSAKIKPADKYIRNPLRALKWGLKCEKIKAFVDEIDADVRRIETLTRLSVKLEPARIRKKIKGKAEGWLKTRAKATRFFESLDSRLPCPRTCCRAPIRLNLQLEVAKNIQTEDIERSMRFIFSRGPEKQARPMKVESEERISSEPNSSRHPQSRVSFARSTTEAEPNQQLKASCCGSEITDICQSLSKPQQNQCLGYLASGDWHHHVHVDNDSPLPVEDEGVRFTSLQEVFRYSGANSFISPVQKYKLAVALSLGIAQLYSTPWLSHAWTTADIFFPEQQPRTPQMDHAYLSRIFATNQSALTGQRSRSRGWVHNEVVYALGIALIELSFEKSILDMKTADDLHNGEVTVTTEWQIATRLLKTFEQREPSRYVEATRACVYCSLGTIKTDLADGTSTEYFHQGVVLPLLQLHKFVIGID